MGGGRQSGEETQTEGDKDGKETRKDKNRDQKGDRQSRSSLEQEPQLQPALHPHRPQLRVIPSPPGKAPEASGKEQNMKCKVTAGLAPSKPPTSCHWVPQIPPAEDHLAGIGYIQNPLYSHLIFLLNRFNIFQANCNPLA